MNRVSSQSGGGNLGGSRSAWSWPLAGVLGVALVSSALAQSVPAGKDPPSAHRQGQGQNTSQAKKPPASQPADEGRDVAPEPYDLAAIDADAGYYQRANPNRLYQRASAAEGQKRPPHILILANAVVETVADKKLDQPLTVKALPGRPVTFVAPDQGTFANGKYSITVKADEEGKAAVEFTVGAPGPYRVLAASPENAGVETFHVYAYPQAVLDEMKKQPADGKRQEWEREVRELEARKGGGRPSEPAASPASGSPSPAGAARRESEAAGSAASQPTGR